MKKQLILTAAACFLAAGVSAQSALLPSKSSTLQKPGISFTENKGQVHDQDGKPRADVLYGVMAGNMAVHIKTSGVSYQLYGTASYKETENTGTNEKGQEPDQQNIYRIDLSWLNCNTHLTSTEDETLPGYSNYYTDNCPEGALNVKSYKGITLNNLYDGIDLHYYEKNGELKHDYLVAPHADYKQIRLQVKGAGISVNKDGSLLLTTPLGDVQEGAPLVYQRGIQKKARWKVENNSLCFEIEKYDPGAELVIDPVTRAWGTYYGGTGVDYAYSCATDISGNVYMAGYTESKTGTIIATTGSHQSVAGGNDGFLVKFDAGGTRLWATYYGGSAGGGSERFNACTTDVNGNVYAAGTTNTYVNPTVIATPGSHQPNFAGQNNNDAFLVKFNAAGVRQWATYYGGTKEESGNSCATDAAGNVYLAGHSQSGTGTVIATSGSHKASYSWAYDAFLVKFNSSGVRQWGTYYGGNGDDLGKSCATDANGDVYLAGMSNSTSGIGTFGGHQMSFGGTGTVFDAYLVKFNTNGVRLWGTYYGGAGTDYGNSCATDAGGNVYLAGTADAATANTVIATGGGHQPANMGGGDAYLAKFDGNGVRLWGTYYGTTQNETGNGCATDAAGNVYLTGSAGASTGTGIATVGSHQAAHGGGADAVLVKFDANGSRQWGTYYGGTTNEYSESCTVDAFGHVYMAGMCELSTGTVIASMGSHQSVYGTGVLDAMLVKFDVCETTPPAQPSGIYGPSVACQGVATTYTTPLEPGASFYTLSLPGGGMVSGSSNIISVTPTASGDFTLVVGNGCGVSPQQTINVTVNPTPTVTVNSGSICAGESFTIVPGGALTYILSWGVVISPNVTTSYFVIGTNSVGCSNTATGTVTVHPLPTITLNSGTVCAGQSFTLVAGGAQSYTYSPPGPVVTPTATGLYLVNGTSAAGCVSQTAAVSEITVNPLPVLTSSTTSNLLCVGEQATLTAGGALNYTFTPGGLTTSIAVSPSTTTSYTISGKDANGCINKSVVTQSVDACTGISRHNNPGSGIKIYPNPTNGVVTLELDANAAITILNAIGQVVYVCRLSAGVQQINLQDLAKGLYVVRVGDGADIKDIKLIRE